MRCRDLFEDFNLPRSAAKLLRDLQKKERRSKDDEEREHIETALNFFDSLEFDIDQQVSMYRMMIVDAEFIEHLLRGKIRHLGFHWATNKSEARVYSYDGARDADTLEVILCASVDFDHLNWDACVDRAEIGESEVMAFAESPLRLKAAWVRGKALRLPPSLPMMQP
jgi:hypothetical protein